MEYTAEEIVDRLQSLSNPVNVEGMARFGINPQGTLGISIPTLRQIAKECRKDHQLAGELWETGVHEARILASMIEEPHRVDELQVERWVKDFDSWDVCDEVCGNLFGQLPLAPQKAMQWSERPEEFVKRAGFTLMAELAAHDKKAKDELFEAFFVPIVREIWRRSQFCAQGGQLGIAQDWKAQRQAERVVDRDSPSNWEDRTRSPPAGLPRTQSEN